MPFRQIGVSEMISLISKLKDEKFWENVRNNEKYSFMIDEIKNRLENTFDETIALRYSDYKLFFSTGNRKKYETYYFDRRAKLVCLAALSLIYPENESYFSALQDIIWAVLDEYSWALPAHAFNNTDNDNTLLDLFSTATGATLSEIYVILEDRLEPLIKSRIRAEIDRRIINSYLERTNTFHWDIGATNNWAAVCSGGVGAVFIHMRPEFFEKVYPRLDANIKRFLSGFPEDGTCLEGVSYWNYGFGFFVFYNDLLRQFSNGNYDYFKDPHVKNIALFNQKVFMQDNVTISFSDGNEHSTYNIGLLSFLKSIYPEIKLPPKKYARVNSGNSDWFYISRSFAYYDEKYFTEIKSNEEAYFLPNAEWLIKASPRLAFAAKGGNNGEPHNHNDVGEFIIAAGDKQELCDLGAGEYTRQYFSAERYSIFCNSSFGHSVPFFDGVPQGEGAEHFGKSTYENGVFTIDITAAYDFPALDSAIRKFTAKDDKITLSDSFSLSSETEITERFITKIKPIVLEKAIELDKIRIIPQADWEISISTQQHSNHKAEKETIYCIDFKKKALTAEFDMKIELK